MSTTGYRIRVHGYGDNLEGRISGKRFPRVHITGRTSDNDELSSLCFDPESAHAFAEAIHLAADEATKYASADVTRTVVLTVTDPDDDDEREPLRPVVKPYEPEPEVFVPQSPAPPSPLDDEIPF